MYIGVIILACVLRQKKKNRVGIDEKRIILTEGADGGVLAD